VQQMNFAEVELCHDLTFVAKSNDLRRAAMEKYEEMHSVDRQIDAKLLKLKN